MPLFGRRRKATVKVRKRDIPNGLWLKCPSCSEIIYKRELEKALGICPKCDYHFQLTRQDRMNLLIEDGSFEEWDADMKSVDTLQFTGTASYESKLKSNIKKTGYNDAITTGKAQIGRHDVAFGVMDFAFLGASMGAVVGEKVARMIERGTEQGMPVVLSCASGGARMYEGLFSLMQMAKTSAALARHSQAGLCYIPILTHPTTAGVMASFATLGDVIIAEPNALIGFAGPRVIKETTQQDLPPGFQRSEFLLDHGLLDMVVHRKNLKKELLFLLDFFDPEQVAEEETPEPTEPETETADAA
jgi:acetyl-CoA carboxylase carboxyl transferase subunit beta